MSEHQGGYVIMHIYNLFNIFFRAKVFNDCNPRLDLCSCEKKLDSQVYILQKGTWHGTAIGIFLPLSFSLQA
jgi:hypothetical protein